MENPKHYLRENLWFFGKNHNLWDYDYLLIMKSSHLEFDQSQIIKITMTFEWKGGKRNK